MNKADQLAIWVKAAKTRCPQIIGVVLGPKERELLRNNPDPCTPPDFDSGNYTFCELPIYEQPYTIGADSQLSLVLDAQQLICPEMPERDIVDHLGTAGWNPNP